MSRSNKVFVYNSKGASDESSQDLATLVRENHEEIFAAKPDVVECNYDFNTDGLDTPTFIVPGGSVTSMGIHVKPHFDRVRQSSVKEDFNYVGICAGAYIGTATADLFIASHKRVNRTQAMHNPCDYFASVNKETYTVGVVDNFQAIGSFFPFAQAKITDALYVPYTVSLEMSANKQSFQSMFVGGCGFIAINSENNAETEVVAHYSNRQSYGFFFKGNNGHKDKDITKLPAIVRRPKCKDKGGVLLSGVHLESSVNDSLFFDAFRNPAKLCSMLTGQEQMQLEDNNPEQKAIAVDLLKTTLK